MGLMLNLPATLIAALLGWVVALYLFYRRKSDDVKNGVFVMLLGSLEMVEVILWFTQYQDGFGSCSRLNVILSSYVVPGILAGLILVSGMSAKRKMGGKWWLFAGAVVAILFLGFNCTCTTLDQTGEGENVNGLVWRSAPLPPLLVLALYVAIIRPRMAHKPMKTWLAENGLAMTIVGGLSITVASFPSMAALFSVAYSLEYVRKNHNGNGNGNVTAADVKFDDGEIVGPIEDVVLQNKRGWKQRNKYRNKYNGYRRRTRQNGDDGMDTGLQLPYTDEPDMGLGSDYIDEPARPDYCPPCPDRDNDPDVILKRPDDVVGVDDEGNVTQFTEDGDVKILPDGTTKTDDGIDVTTVVLPPANADYTLEKLECMEVPVEIERSLRRRGVRRRAVNPFREYVCRVPIPPLPSGVMPPPPDLTVVPGGDGKDDLVTAGGDVIPDVPVGSDVTVIADPDADLVNIVVAKPDGDVDVYETDNKGNLTSDVPDTTTTHDAEGNETLTIDNDPTNDLDSNGNGNGNGNGDQTLGESLLGGINRLNPFVGSGVAPNGEAVQTTTTYANGVVCTRPGRGLRRYSRAVSRKASSRKAGGRAVRTLAGRRSRK